MRDFDTEARHEDNGYAWAVLQPTAGTYVVEPCPLWVAENALATSPSGYAHTYAGGLAVAKERHPGVDMAAYILVRTTHVTVAL